VIYALKRLLGMGPAELNVAVVILAGDISSGGIKIVA